jgi:hypothetical protein
VDDWLTRLGPRVESMASSLADIIVANSQSARSQAVMMGMNRQKIVVITKRIRCERFRPVPRTPVSAPRVGIDDRAPVLGGRPARPMKNHELPPCRALQKVRGDITSVGSHETLPAALVALASGSRRRTALPGLRPATGAAYSASTFAFA